MQASYFETGRYYAPSNLPRQWPMQAYCRVERMRLLPKTAQKSVSRIPKRR
jgi:hypothetical protein